MLLRKGHKELTVIEAVDHLSNLAELDLLESEIPQERSGALTLSWQDPTYYAYHREQIKETITVLNKYINELYGKDKGQLQEGETQRAIQALILLANEAAQKIDKYTEIFKGEGSVTELKEFKELQHFYLTKVAQKFQGGAEAEEKWHEEWGLGAEEKPSAQGLRDLEAIRQDREYELFFIRKDDGLPYFNRSLLRHLQMVGQFDTLLLSSSQEDPFQRLKMAQDRDLHLSAKEILHLASTYLDDYFKEAMKYKQMRFVAAVNKALMALMLASDTRNLVQSTIGKSAQRYYADFHYYLRNALTSPEYHRFLENPPKLTDRFQHILMNLSALLCASSFTRVGSRKEMVALIRSWVEKGTKASERQLQTSSPLSLWNNLMDEDASLRDYLQRYPSGPLMKTLQLFRQRDELKGFDPMFQQNFPGSLYLISGDQLHISCMRMACPTNQEMILKAEFNDEFSNFIDSLRNKKNNQRYLLINLQDRTSWKEHARCTALEKGQKKAEFIETLIVITLPKDTDFYKQSGPYHDSNDALEFLEQFAQQIAGAEECGFYFPAEIDQKEILKFSKAAMEIIHQVFFASNAVLLHKNRLDFIEIFYLLLTLKCIELSKPDLLSFSCKDAIDTGAAATAALYSFLRLMNDPSAWSKEEKGFLLWMLYAPALTLRQRAIDVTRLHRVISALAIVNAELEAHYENTVTTCSALYAISFFKDLKVKEVE